MIRINLLAGTSPLSFPCLVFGPKCGLAQSMNTGNSPASRSEKKSAASSGDFARCILCAGAVIITTNYNRLKIGEIYGGFRFVVRKICLKTCYARCICTIVVGCFFCGWSLQPVEQVVFCATGKYRKYLFTSTPVLSIGRQVSKKRRRPIAHRHCGIANSTLHTRNGRGLKAISSAWAPRS